MGIQSVLIEMVGKKCGKLTILARSTANRKKKGAYWDCICDCGNTATVWGPHLRSGRTVSCGCAKKDGARKTADKTLAKDPRKASARHVFGHHYKDGNLSFESFLDISQQPCHYCGTLPDKSNCYNRYKTRYNNPNVYCALDDLTRGDFYYNGLDRINNQSAHNIDNVVPCCRWCNAAKLDRSYDDFIIWIKQIYHHTIQKETDSNCLESVS